MNISSSILCHWNSSEIYLSIDMMIFLSTSHLKPSIKISYLTSSHHTFWLLKGYYEHLQSKISSTNWLDRPRASMFFDYCIFRKEPLGCSSDTNMLILYFHIQSSNCLMKAVDIFEEMSYSLALIIYMQYFGKPLYFIHLICCSDICLNTFQNFVKCNASLLNEGCFLSNWLESKWTHYFEFKRDYKCFQLQCISLHYVRSWRK